MEINDDIVEIKNVSKTFFRPDDTTIPIFKNFNLKLKRGRIYSIIGESGCGKSTLVNIIGGFETVDSGEIKINGSHSVGILFQDNVLYPWMTILENMIIACKNQFTDPKLMVTKYLSKIGLEDIIDCYPNELSGGMQQRIALLRVLLTKPDFIILDEAFGALDVQTRSQMQDLFLEMHNDEKFTSLIITHDLLEAVKLSNEIIVFFGQPLDYKIITIKKGVANETVKILQEIQSILGCSFENKNGK